ncbi:MAG: phosphomannomutase/phosphoglucomutase [Actinomycetota bacterium]
MSLERIFKAYDIRGIYPDELTEAIARDVGAAFAGFAESDRVVVGRDCRASSPALAEAFASGVTSTGTDVLDIGLATTDMVYFASGRLGLPGAMFTASHNPPEYNGIKLCRAGAAPVGEDSGLQEIRAAVESGRATASDGKGARERRDLVAEFVDHVVSFVEPDAVDPLTVVADAANGMAGLVLEPIFDRLPAKLVGLYLELDGTFPNHPADPIQPENQEDLRKAVIEHGADIGLAFDGDADRVFLVDETGESVSGSLVTALVAETMLEREPGGSVIHNLICSRVVPEVIREHGGTPIRTRVGHSFIKKVMAETGAIFGGEHSGHYYFRDHYRADSGLIAALIVLERLSRAGAPLSRLLEPYRRYEASGEINSEVLDQLRAIERVAGAFADGRHDRLDGLTVEYVDWWFNVRPSNTEPLLRLNVEARTPELLEEKTRAVLEVIRT